MLVGRDNEQDALIEALRQHRLVTLTGPGGVGKTSLVQSVLGLLAADQYDTVDFIDMTELSEHGLMGGVIGTIGFGSLDQMAENKATRSWLVALDNCEHLLDPIASVVETLLKRLEGLTVVATSREPLALPGEFAIRLDPFPLTGRPSQAARLFVSKAMARGARIEMDSELVEDICRLVDGLPLAIELAAAKTKSMTLEEIRAGLDAPLELLEDVRSRRPDRHVTLTSTIAWSYSTLSGLEQQALSALAIFNSPFSTRMAEVAMDEKDSRDLLESLVDKSFVEFRPTRGESWFRMLGTIRAFADAELEPSRRQTTRRRVVDWIISELDDLLSRLSHVPPLIVDGFPTVRRSIEHAIDYDEDSKRVFDLMSRMWWLDDLGHQPELIALAERALKRWPDLQTGSGVGYGILSMFQRVSNQVDESESNGRVAISAGGLGSAFGHRSIGHTLRRRGAWADALQHFTAGAKEASAAGNAALALELRLHQAITLARSGEMESAVGDLQRLIEESEEFPLVNRWARLFFSWTLFPSSTGHAGEISESILAEKAETDPWVIAVAHQHMGIAMLLEGDVDAAVPHLVASLRKFESIRNRSDVALTIRAVAALLNRVGRTVEAQRAMAAATTYAPDETYGQFEIDLYESIGPLPDSASAKPYSTQEILEILDSWSSGGGSGVHGTGNLMERLGDLWNLGFNGLTVPVTDSKGIRDIATLVSQPHVEISSLDLMQSGLTSSSAGAISDDIARSQYRQRLLDLQSELEEAEAAHDPYRADRARTEMDVLIDQLGSAYGLRGRERSTNDPAERARSAVTARIRSSIKKLRRVHPDLADHFDRSISTGRFCIYRPDPPSDAMVVRLDLTM